MCTDRLLSDSGCSRLTVGLNKYTKRTHTTHNTHSLTHSHTHTHTHTHHIYAASPKPETWLFLAWLLLAHTHGHQWSWRHWRLRFLQAKQWHSDMALLSLCPIVAEVCVSHRSIFRCSRAGVIKAASSFGQRHNFQQAITHRSIRGQRKLEE